MNDSQSKDLFLHNYILNPLSEILSFLKLIFFSLFMISKIHNLLDNTSDEVAIKKSREFLFLCIAITTSIVSLVLILPTESITLRKDIIYSLLKPILLQVKVILLLSFQGILLYLFLIKIRSITINKSKFMSLFAIFIGGPVSFSSALINCFIFSFPTSLQTNYFASALSHMGTFGLILHVIVLLYLFRFFWPYISRPRWKGFSTLTVVWMITLMTSLLIGDLLEGRSTIQTFKESMLEHKVGEAQEKVFQAAKKNSLFIINSFSKKKRPPTYYELCCREPCMDPWGNRIIEMDLWCIGELGDRALMVLAISKGPNQVIDITEDDFQKLLRTQVPNTLMPVSAMKSLIEKVMLPYDPKKLESEKDRKNINSVYGKESWSKVDLYATFLSE